MKFNHAAIAATVVMHMALGAAWYSPALFQGPWLAGLGKKASDMNPSDPGPFAIAITCSVLSCYIFSWCVERTRMTGARHGALLGVLLWAGFALPSIAPHYSFAGISLVVSAIDGLNSLVASAATGAILGGWRAK